MSLQELESDLKSLGEKLRMDPPASAAGVVLFLQNELVPWLQDLTKETVEIDESVEDLVHGSAEILHEESGAVFAGIIASGLAIATELAQRAGNDQRILKIIREFRQIAKEGSDILDEIVIPDPEDGDDEAEGDEGDEGDDAKDADDKPAKEQGA